MGLEAQKTRKSVRAEPAPLGGECCGIQCQLWHHKGPDGGRYSDKWHCLFPESTQLEDPRAQWQREQESMLRDYLSVARDALSAQKEIYQVKEQRLLLAQQEYRQLNDAWRDKSTSQTSREFHTLSFPWFCCSRDWKSRVGSASKYLLVSPAVNSRSSSSSKYDPDILKAEIATSKSRVSSRIPHPSACPRCHDTERLWRLIRQHLWRINLIISDSTVLNSRYNVSIWVYTILSTRYAFVLKFTQHIHFSVSVHVTHQAGCSCLEKRSVVARLLL